MEVSTIAELLARAEAHPGLGETGLAIVRNIVTEHVPESPPPGMRWLGSKSDDPRCSVCSSGDPYLDDRFEWPCPPVRTIIDALDQ